MVSRDKMQVRWREEISWLRRKLVVRLVTDKKEYTAVADAPHACTNNAAVIILGVSDIYYQEMRINTAVLCMFLRGFHGRLFNNQLHRRQLDRHMHS
jgi:hypothetical protein